MSDTKLKNRLAAIYPKALKMIKEAKCVDQREIIHVFNIAHTTWTQLAQMLIDDQEIYCVDPESARKKYEIVTQKVLDLPTLEIEPDKENKNIILGDDDYSKLKRFALSSNVSMSKLLSRLVRECLV